MSEQPSPRLIRRAVTSVILVVVFLSIGMAGFQKLAAMKRESLKSPARTLPEVVRVETAKQVNYTERLSGYGKARALRRTAVSAEVPGLIEWIADRIEPGIAIEFDPTTNGNAPPSAGDDARGPLVVRLEKQDLEDQLERVQAEIRGVDAEVAKLATVRANLEERLTLAQEEEATARREFARVERLVDTKRLPRGDLDSERLKLSLRERAVIEHESSLRNNEKEGALLAARRSAREQDARIAARNLRRAEVHVPAPGIVVARHVGAGDRVGIGTPLFTMIDLSTVEIPIALPARRFGDVLVGSEAKVLDAQTGAVLWQGAVTRVAPTINERERTFHVFLEVPGEPTRNPVTPGRHVRAEIRGKTHPGVVVVPREAFVGEDLYVVTPDPDAPTGGVDRFVIAHRRTPVLARLLTGVALVSEGLDDGDVFVVSNLESVADQSRLRVAAETGE